jgi:hypothetical protein
VTEQTSPDPLGVPGDGVSGADVPPGADPEVGTGSVARQHPVFVYTLLRIAMLVVVGAVLYVVGVRGVWLILFAFLVSGVLSAFVLRTPREGAVIGFTSVYRGINDRIDASTRAEDADDDLDEPLDGRADGTSSATS